MVADSRFPHKHPRQLLQRLLIKPLHIIVAQHHPKAVQLLLAKFPSGQPVDLLQILLPDRHLTIEQVPFLFTLHLAPPPAVCPFG